MVPVGAAEPSPASSPDAGSSRGGDFLGITTSSSVEVYTVLRAGNWKTEDDGRDEGTKLDLCRLQSLFWAS